MTGRAAAATPRNPLAVAGLVVAIAAIVIGLFSFAAGLLLAFVALVLSAIGFWVWHKVRVGRMPAAAGLIIGGLAFVSSAYFVAAGA